MAMSFPTDHEVILPVPMDLSSNGEYDIYIYIYIYEMKSLLSLEGLRPPLSRDSSTYTHAMSYFAWLFNRCLCMTLLTDSLLVLVAHQSLPGGTDGFSSWCCWCLLGVAIRCGSLRSWSSVLRPLS